MSGQVTEIGSRYLWWDPIGANPHSFERTVAQIMNLGRYEDILLLEALLEPEELLGLMREAQPGWFSDRSWDFWRGRLSSAGSATLPSEPPRRHFARASTLRT